LQVSQQQCKLLKSQSSKPPKVNKNETSTTKWICEAVPLSSNYLVVSHCISRHSGCMSCSCTAATYSHDHGPSPIPGHVRNRDLLRLHCNKLRPDRSEGLRQICIEARLRHRLLKHLKRKSARYLKALRLL
jgi:hypothetical protein